MEPTRTAIGTWSGGRFMHFGEEVSEERLIELLRPGRGIDTVLTADTYGQGAADELLGQAIADVDRDSFSLVGAVGHDFYEGERDGPRGFPRFTDPRLRGPDDYASYLRMATERTLERLGTDRLDLLLLHNPDRTGYSSEVVWEAMAGLRAEGLTHAIGVAPGPANGFTLDLLDCFERFGELLDWGMVILNPFEPWPGEMVLEAAAQRNIKLITRVVDYGGLFWGDVRPGHTFAERDHRKFRPEGWVDAGANRLASLSPILERTGLTTIQLACAWNLAQPAVECVAPTLIQEIGDDARSIEDKRAELAELPADPGLTDADLEEIRRIGDNAGCMALKGASAEHEGEQRPDRWALTPELEAVAERWGIDPGRDLVKFPEHA
jgi:aryl-alcohol dehydrogenase-like predicted oxidoreductase